MSRVLTCRFLRRHGTARGTRHGTQFYVPRAEIDDVDSFILYFMCNSLLILIVKMLHAARNIFFGNLKSFSENSK